MRRRRTDDYTDKEQIKVNTGRVAHCRGCAAAHHRTPDCQSPSRTRKHPPNHPYLDGSPTSHPYIVVDQINKYKDDGKRIKSGYSNRAFFLEPPAEDVDNALERFYLVTGSVPSGKSSEYIKLCTFRYDFITISRSAFISCVSMRDICICARNSRGSDLSG